MDCYKRMEDFYWDFYFHSLPPIQTLAHLYSVLLPVQLPCYANRSVTIIFVHRLSQSPGRLSGDYGKQPLPMTVNSLGLSQHVHNTQTPSCWEQWLSRLLLILLNIASSVPNAELSNGKSNKYFEYLFYAIPFKWGPYTSLLENMWNMAIPYGTSV